MQHESEMLKEQIVAFAAEIKWYKAKVAELEREVEKLKADCSLAWEMQERTVGECKREIEWRERLVARCAGLESAIQPIIEHLPTKGECLDEASLNEGRMSPYHIAVMKLRELTPPKAASVEAAAGEWSPMLETGDLQISYYGNGGIEIRDAAEIFVHLSDRQARELVEWTRGIQFTTIPATAPKGDKKPLS